MSDQQPRSPWGDQRPRITAEPALYAGFWRRLGAYIIDGILLLIPAYLIFDALGLYIPPPPMPLEQMTAIELDTYMRTITPVYMQSSIVSLGVGWTYFALMECSPRRATFGKGTFGLFVTDLDGNRISFARATGRYFGKILSGIILLVGYLMAAFTLRKQALHDILAGTLVMRRELPSGPPTRD